MLPRLETNQAQFDRGFMSPICKDTVYQDISAAVKARGDLGENYLNPQLPFGQILACCDLQTEFTNGNDRSLWKDLSKEEVSRSGYCESNECVPQNLRIYTSLFRSTPSFKS